MKLVVAITLDILSLLGAALIGVALGWMANALIDNPDGRSMFLIQAIFISIGLFLISIIRFRGVYPNPILRWLSSILAVEFLIVCLYLYFSGAVLAEEFTYRWLLQLNAFFLLPIILGIGLSRKIS